MSSYNQNETSLENIGRNIRRWREFREMSGETLARAVCMEKSQISKIENGRNPGASVRTMEEIAKALGLTFEQLINTSPQTIITITQSPGNNGSNYDTQNNIDVTLVEDLRQQLKTKDEQIKFLQRQFQTK